MVRSERYVSILLFILAMLISFLLIITVFTAPAMGQKQPNTPSVGSVDRQTLAVAQEKGTSRVLWPFSERGGRQ